MFRELSRLEVYYDSWCPLCTSIKHRLARIDWLGRLSFYSMREPDAVMRAGIPEQRLAERMVVRHPQTGLIAEGIWAIAAISLRIPLLWPLWPLIQLSARLGLGQQLYDAVAKQRMLIPVGHCDERGCRIHTGKQ